MVIDFFTVVTDHWQIVSGIILLIALSQSLITLLLKSIFGGRLNFNEYLAFSFSGWILPASLFSILWLFLGRILTLTVFLFLMIILLPSLMLRTDSKPASRKVTFSLLMLVLLFIPLRLVFVAEVPLPSYFDSAQHYLSIKNLLANRPTTEIFSLTHYYHPGFHILTAFFVSVLDADISQTMLILGQLTLAIMPVSIFFLVKYMTGENQAGFFAVILSAFGWYMPAHTVNWGKYPALTSLALMPFVLSLAYLLWQNRNHLSLSKRWALYSTLGISSVITILMHSRALAVLAIIFLAWVIAIWQGKLSFINRILICVVIIIVFEAEVLFIQREALFTLLLDPYTNKGIWITSLVLGMSIFAWKEYSQVMFTCILSMCFLLGSLFLPVNVPGYGPLTLLDRPFVEMILYLPLSVMGGLGLAGFIKVISQSRMSRFLLHQYTGVLVMGLVGIHAFYTYNFYPSQCCVIAGDADMATIKWIGNQLPEEARIGISGTELDVLTSEAPEGIAGSDAGIWITPLIDRSTILLLYSSDFGQQSARDMLCNNRVDYLYVGGLGQSFDTKALNEHPEWYSAILSMQKIKVYEVVGCD